METESGGTTIRDVGSGLLERSAGTTGYVSQSLTSASTSVIGLRAASMSSAGDILCNSSRVLGADVMLDMYCNGVENTIPYQAFKSTTSTVALLGRVSEGHLRHYADILCSEKVLMMSRPIALVEKTELEIPFGTHSAHTEDPGKSFMR